VPARLPLAAQRLVVVTGKGGVGKSAVAAALARAAAKAGRRVLAVEVGAGRLGALLGGALGAEPRPLGPRLAAATIEPEAALADFVLSVLKLRVLARRLLESTSFQVLAAAAPGLPEFLVLHRLSTWLDARRLGRFVYDLVVVDAPATGHSLPLLAAPRALGALAHVGPVAERLSSIGRRLADPTATLVCLVTTPEELAVRETVDLHRELAGRLGLPVAPPIVNALPPRRFTAADVAALARLETNAPAHPYLAAARLELARRREAAAQVAVLRRSLGTPVRLPFLYGGPESDGGLARLSAELALAAGLAA